MTLLDNKKVKDSNDVIPRHSPKLGTNQGDANTYDELLLRWWWRYDLDWSKKPFQHSAESDILFLEYFHLPPQGSVLITELICNSKYFRHCRKRAVVRNRWYCSLQVMRKSTLSVNRSHKGGLPDCMLFSLC